ncbi:MAG: C39 family peptidase [Paludibacter sp.]
MKYLKLTPILFLLFLSCSKDKDIEDRYGDINVDFTIADSIDHFILNDHSTDINGAALTYKWTLSSDTIPLFNPNSASAYFNLPILKDSQQLTIKHVVSNGLVSDSVIRNITLPKTTVERLYGLGIKVDYSQSNNDNYNWYYDQMDTGPYSSVNCGPTTVTMAIKWVQEDFTKTTLDARNTYRPSGGWWYTNDITNYLNMYSVPNYIIPVKQIDSLQSQINSGNIIILCLDMYYIRNQGKDKWHIDKFYTASTIGWGHFIVVKGYKIVDKTVYYEVYDPYSFGKKYSNGLIKGKDRYYRSVDLNSAVLKWWAYAIVVSKTTQRSGIRRVKASEIKHKPGQ